MKALQFPLVRITVFFVFGIISANYFKPMLNTMLWVTLLAFATCFTSMIHSRRQLTQKLLFGITVYCFSYTAGLLAYTLQNGHFQKNHYIHRSLNEEERHVVKLLIKEKLKSNTYNDRYVAKVTALDGKPSNGLILMNIRRNKPVETNIAIGSEILTQGQIVKHKPPQNPNQFDYGNYLLNKSIPAQIYIANHKLKITDTVKNPAYYAAALRDRIVRNLRKSDFGKEELAVVTALILGQQQDISEDTIKEYQYAGAIHILSVSGLHVGFVMLFINFILARLPKNRKGNTIRVVAVLSALWVFSLIAGLSPSIVRSATMFSVVAIGMYLKRETYIFHTLLASLLLILMVSPSFLFDVGFQLSYVSLFFILWLQPYFYGLWNPKSKPVKYFWNIVTVSVAAQLGALPLSIYYFHQFPGLFFVTNIMILPALGLIMGFGVLVMMAAFFGAVPYCMAKSLEFLIWLLNETIAKIASLEQFIIKDIPLNLMLMLSLYLVILSLFAWLMKKSFRNLIYSISFLLVFQAIFIHKSWECSTTAEMIFFKSSNASLIAERKGKKITVFCDGGRGKNTSQDKSITAYRVANFSSISKTAEIQNLLFFNGRKIYAVDSTGTYPEGIRADILLMTHSPKVNFERMITQLKPGLVIADASNFKTYTQLWKSSCRKQKIPFHAIAEKGFYKLE